MAPGRVLHADVGVLDRALPVTTGAQLPYGHAGPGAVAERQLSVAPAPIRLDVTTPGFVVRADHGLLQLDALFGLSRAADARECGTWR
ncbi:hypothetical protein OHB00_06730 [Streptomyces sp. NBC_00631]|uniref:hypothetical protein n=1 Tax=Streptomyces sp. NBC_00631 TaxID=2975793 RepID=UPI0030E3C29E